MSSPMENVVAALERLGSRRIGNDWTCPVHEDEKPSLSVGEGADRRVLLKCQRGCSTEAVVAALGLQMADLFENRGRRGMDEPTHVYDYVDERGNLLFQVCRFPGKKFRQRRPGPSGKWTWNLDGVRRVLYRLADLVSRPGETVFVVEGEKDVDRLRELELFATTNPMGAGKWRDEYKESLRDRDVAIIPDSDEAGKKHAQDVALSLHGVARTVKILELQGLDEKGDVSDWLSKHSKQELLWAAEGTELYQGSGGNGGTGGGQQTQQSNGRESLAHRLIPLVLETGVELFHDQRGDTYAAVRLEDGHRRTMSLASKAFAQWMSRLSWVELDKALNSEQRISVQNVLSGMALYDGPQYELSVRCTVHENAFWVDLDGLRAVRVVPGRWEIVDVPPILFRPFAHLRPIPDPVRGGDPGLVLRFVNLKDETDKILFQTYLVVGFIPHIPIVALIVHGVQGAAKTTLLKIAKGLLDPSAVAVRGGVRDQTEFALAAFQNRVLYFDNLTSIPDWLSDALCRAVTGEGWSKRSLYTDEDATVLEYRGLVGLSGINLVSDRADLLDRSLIMELDPVAPDQRRQEGELWSDFEVARPLIVGGLLDALARAMQVEPGLMPRSLPRMADFARWGAAAAIGLRLNPLDFLRAYERNVGRQNEAVIEASPLAQALLAFMSGREEWEGTPADLHGQLHPIAEEIRVDMRSKRWRKNASWVSRRLKEVMPSLLAMGLKVESDRGPGSRGIRVTAMPSSGGNGVMAQHIPF